MKNITIQIDSSDLAAAVLEQLKNRYPEIHRLKEIQSIEYDDGSVPVDVLNLPENNLFSVTVTFA